MKKPKKEKLIKIDNEYFNPKCIISIKEYENNKIYIYLENNNEISFSGIAIEKVLKHLNVDVIDITGE